MSNKNNNLLKNNFNKEIKRNNDIANNLQLNTNNIHSNKRHNSMVSKNIKSFNYNKHILPKLQEHEIKIFGKDINNYNNVSNTQNVKSVDFNLNQFNNLLSGKKNIKLDSKNNTSSSKDRIPSAKIRIMKSSYQNYSEDNPNLNMKNSDEKKNNNINQNLRYSYNYEINLDDKHVNVNNKQFSMTLRPRSKIMKINKNSFISNKIYIDANK